MTNVLLEQAHTYRKQAALVSAEVASSGLSTEDFIDVGLALYEAAKRSVGRWKERVRSGLQPLSIEDARGLDESYRELGRAFDTVAGEVAAGRGRFDPTSVARFERAHAELRTLLSVPFDGVLESTRQLEQGHTRPFGEVMDELCGGHHG